MSEARASITERPSTSNLVEEIAAATGMSKSDVYNVGVDVLHFVWNVLTKEGSVAVKFPADDDFKPVAIVIPGLGASKVGPS